jgi:pimeloyl-ACP methyl ester carboxylesterase
VTDLDAFSLAKHFIHVGDARVAYRDQGTGPPVVLLHGCPFSSFVWRNILAALADADHRVLAPDLLGLGGNDPHFGPPGAERLAGDISGVNHVEILADAGHLLMEDQPERATDVLTQILPSPTPTPDPVQLDSARP